MMKRILFVHPSPDPEQHPDESPSRRNLYLPDPRARSSGLQIVRGRSLIADGIARHKRTRLDAKMSLCHR